MAKRSARISKRSKKRAASKRARVAARGLPTWDPRLASGTADEDAGDDEDEDGAGGDAPPWYEDDPASTDEDAPMAQFDDDMGDETSDEDAPQFFQGSDYGRGESSMPGY
jgi:hypothetical protein